MIARVPDFDRMDLLAEEATTPPTLAVVVPTYCEAENVRGLVERLAAVREQHGYPLDLWLMDDDSRDGIEQVVADLALPWVHLVIRHGERGLGLAVLDGLRQAAGDVFVVMDADLSHPPEALPSMLERLRQGADFVVGSRFTAGGTTDDDWGMFRFLNSRVATFLALPLTTIKDPMSGYFMLRRSTFEAGRGFDPIGYKIGLELYVKCGCRNAVEVPIHFADRRAGASKLSLREQLRYLIHIRRLYIYRFELFSQIAQFLAVGASGLAVNLLVLTALVAVQVPVKVAMVVAIALSMIWNFALNRRFSFSYARGASILKQFAGFVSACAVGALVNYGVALAVLDWLGHPQLAATVGVVVATGINFMASRLYVFKQRHVVVGRADEPSERD